MHTDRCRFAKTDESKCKCSCKGVLHGLSEDVKLDPDEKILTEEDGGEVGKFIKKYKNKKYMCLGHSKNNIHTVNTFYGYPHDGGLSDKIRLAGWIIRRGDMGAKKVQRYQCVNCGYSFTLDHIRRKKEKVE